MGLDRAQDKELGAAADRNTAEDKESAPVCRVGEAEEAGEAGRTPAPFPACFSTAFDFVLPPPPGLSSPVIKCKKTPRKKCSLVAEVKGKR